MCGEAAMLTRSIPKGLILPLVVPEGHNLEANPVSLEVFHTC